MASTINVTLSVSTKVYQRRSKRDGCPRPHNLNLVSQYVRQKYKRTGAFRSQFLMSVKKWWMNNPRSKLRTKNECAGVNTILENFTAKWLKFLFIFKSGHIRDTFVAIVFEIFLETCDFYFHFLLEIFFIPQKQIGGAIL